MNANYANLTPKEKKIHREASANGMKDLILMLISQKVSDLGSLNEALSDGMVKAMISQVEACTGFSVRISADENGSPIWGQIDLSEDTISSVRMKNRQVMRAQIAGVQIEFLVAQYQEKETVISSHQRDDVAFALRRLASVIERFEDPVLNIQTLADGKKYKWDISETGSVVFDSDEKSDSDEPDENVETSQESSSQVEDDVLKEDDARSPMSTQ